MQDSAVTFKFHKSKAQGRKASTRLGSRHREEVGASGTNVLLPG